MGLAGLKGAMLVCGVLVLVKAMLTIIFLLWGDMESMVSSIKVKRICRNVCEDRWKETFLRTKARIYTPSLVN